MRTWSSGRVSALDGTRHHDRRPQDARSAPEALRGERFEQDGVQCRWKYETGWETEIDSVMREMFRPVCYPKNLTAERIARMTVAFLEGRPQERRLPGATLVAAAIREPFACAED